MLAALVIAIPVPPQGGGTHAPFFAEVRAHLPPGAEEPSIGPGRAFVEPGDVDGDGDLDVLLGTDGQFYPIYRNDGAGHFSYLPRTAMFDDELFLPTAAWNGELVDLDADGDLDALIVNPYWPGPTLLFLNDGDGCFAKTVGKLPGSATYNWNVATGDVDGDGDVDVFLSSLSQSGSSDDALLLNDGSATFADASDQLPQVTYVSACAALGDLDGDGDLDALLGRYSTDPDELYRNDGTGVFTADAGAVPDDHESTNEVRLGDVDADGDLDAWLCDTLHPRLYVNDGAGSFADETLARLPLVFMRNEDVALGDVDGDGDLDALLGNANTFSSYYSSRNRLYLNEGGGYFSNATQQLPRDDDDTDGVALADVDRDGDLDAVIGNIDEQSRLYLNDGDGRFVDVTASLDPPRGLTEEIALGDLNGDGLPDALSAVRPSLYQAQSDSQNRLYLNDGSGPWVDASDRLPQAQDWTLGVALLDVDLDGDLDAALANGAESGYAGEPNRILVNDSGVAFVSTPLATPGEDRNSQTVETADLDGDGAPDLVFGNVHGPSVWLNSGSGDFPMMTAFSFGPWTTTRALALGDFDRDGDVDAYAGNEAGNGDFQVPGAADRLLLNDGTGKLHESTGAVPSLATRTRDVAAGDVDADGDLDVVVATMYESASYGPGKNQLFTNAGDGTFGSATNDLGLDSWSTQAVTLVDLDTDGDLDVIFGNGSTSDLLKSDTRLHVLSNDGSGAFENTGARYVGRIRAGVQALATSDVDADGDLDLVLSSYDQPRVLTNLFRQLHRRGAPCIGKALVLELHGRPHGNWLLASAPHAASLPLPPFGVFRLDPASVQFVAVGALSPEGRAEHTWHVPNSPDLIGETIYWQALLGPRPVFSNLELTTLTDL